ncbi:hypothetical protein JZ751_014539 [Albula glossodonta]|uniref:Acylamino-acid-releasing enzyme N-terminal domain-containing protein n=1 Tax=Albula glossodonta TaxID=121402 RepID=A0A8T2N1Z6_9TELE|nr:hypothetical protein JZ751_014539 [Albula glossodonta]
MTLLGKVCYTPALLITKQIMSTSFYVHHSRLCNKVITNPDEIAKLFREQSLAPSLTRADVGPVITSQYGGKYCNIYTEWSQRDLERNENVKFCRQYIVFHDDKLLSKDSPSGDMKAVVRECTVKGEEQQFLEVWSKNSKVKSINLTALKKHGKVYEDDQFGSLVWSHSETHLLYVAEKKRPKTESFFKGDQFVFYEDWGESLVSKSAPVLCILDVEGSNISVLEGVPDNISPGQAFWAPNDTGVVFVGWWHEPFHLGLKHCPNRRPSPVHGSKFSPRDQRKNSLDGFTGIYSSYLSPFCWSEDSQRVLLSCPQRSRKDLLLVDIGTGNVTSLTEKSDVGSWSLLTVKWNLMVVSCSSPNCPPSLGRFLAIGWISGRGELGHPGGGPTPNGH